MFDAIDHVGVLTADADRTASFFESVGMPVVYEEHNEDYNVRVVMAEFGDTYFELLEPFGPGMIRDALDEQGNDFHHVAYRVADIEATVEALGEEGFTFREDEPGPGAGESLIIHIAAEHTDGLTVELVEPLPGDFRVS